MIRPGIDVTVVNYQTPDDLDQFLKSFYDFEPVSDFSLTVVNNCPTESDLNVTDKWFSHIHGMRILNNQENVGYAKAVNMSVAKGNRECIAIFNADVILTANAIESCYVNLMGTEDWGVLGPRQVNLDGRHTAAGIFGTEAAPRHRGWLAEGASKFTDVRDDAVTVSGAAFFIKRSVWNELLACGIYQHAHPEAEGAFLPTPHFYEETWCSYHARAHGYKCVYFGVVDIIHKWHQASPLGGEYTRNAMPISQQMFREMCDLHGIERD